MELLNGIWDFAFSENSDELPKHYPYTTVVPGCFDTMVEFGGKKGVGFYRRYIELEGDYNYCITLEGVAHNGKVYLDGKLIASHHGAFTAFQVDLQIQKTGTYELIIIADNRFDGLNRPLHMPHFDWYSSGGIIRPVTLEKWNDVLINRIEPVITDWKNGEVNLKIYCKFADDVNFPLNMEISYNGDIIAANKIENASNIIEQSVKIPFAKPWTPEEPNLYPIKVRIGNSQRTVNLGFRDIRTEGDKILLNDKPVRLRGVNRHDSSAQFGFALPNALTLYDVHKMKELGCNFVRTSHYPPSQIFMDLCDKVGLLVWCEANAWQYSVEMMKDGRVLTAQKQCISEMIEQYGHHPSIICWGLLNECDSSNEKARPFYEQLISLIRELDPSRPVTYASCYCPPQATPEETRINDVMFDLADWISLNLYPGWYTGDTSDCVERFDYVAKRFQEAGYNKPIIISEIGAGGISEFDFYYPVKWSLSYQSLIMEKLLEYIRQNKLFNGVAIWQYGDILTEADLCMRRPKQHNNKGLVDEFRRPKPVCEIVKKIFNQQW